MSSPKPLILVVEDDKPIAAAISQQLERAGMQTQVYYRASHVLRFLKNNFANLLLLDINLPDQTGFSLLQDIQQHNIRIPIIFLTGDDSEMYKVKGLEMGADDYVTKPFSYAELIARIHAVLRRAETAQDFNVTNNVKVTQEPFDFCGARVFPLRMEMEFTQGEPHKIGKKELGIMAYVASHPHTVITRRSLIHAVWGLHADIRSRSLDQYIVKIRNAFSSRDLATEVFKTLHGVGYIYRPEEEALAETLAANGQARLG